MTIPQMQAAIGVWDTIRNTEQGYYYLVSGLGFSFDKSNYQQWPSNTTTIYCHLGVWNAKLIFILTTVEDPTLMTELDTFALNFHSEVKYTANLSNSLPGMNSVIPKSEALNQVLYWLVYSNDWFDLQIANNWGIMKYVKIDYSDFTAVFANNVNDLVSFFGIGERDMNEGVETPDMKAVTSIILCSKPSLVAQDNTLPTLVFADVTTPVPPFNPI